MAVRQKPEKYRDIVLWACKRNLAYDAQSEGTRSWYVYTMANTYPDREIFIRTVAEALRKYRPKAGWDLLYFSELLMFFASDGWDFARKTVEDKYQEFLAAMFALKRRPRRVFHELTDLEELGLVLAEDRTAFLRIAKDFGRLYREKSYMMDGEFPWFFAEKGGQYRKTLEHAAQKDETFIDNIAVEYRLDNSGTRYVKLFHEKNYESVLEGEVIETGLGVVLRKKVSNLGELFIFKKKKNEEENEE
jgi:hypothetical protein